MIDFISNLSPVWWFVICWCVAAIGVCILNYFFMQGAQPTERRKRPRHKRFMIDHKNN